MSINMIKEEMLNLIAYLEIEDFILYKNVMLVSVERKDLIEKIERKLKLKSYIYYVYKNKNKTKYCIDIKLKNERDDYLA